MQARRAREVARQVNLRLAIGAGQTRVGRAEQRQRRHIQRRGEVAETGVHRDAGLCTGQHLADTGQVQLGQHFDVFQVFGDALGTGLLQRIAPGQFHRHAEVADPLGQLAPVGFRPVLGVPGGAVQEHYVRIFARQLHQTVDIQAVVAQTFGQVITQCHGE
ncbi:hypothetical protein D3C87_1404270 [compost metagenome]